MSQIENKLPEIPIDYVTNDYRGYFELMKEAIPSLTPEWTDTSDTDQGIVILQLLSYGLHILGYYQERVMQENILEMARTKKGILTGCGFLGYTPSRQTASVVTLKIKKDSDFLMQEKTVPTKSKFSTNPSLGIPIVFETSEPLVIPPGEEYGYVIAVQGETYEGQAIGVSNGRPNQFYTIAESDVLEDSIFIYTVENNMVRAWIKVDNFLESTQNDRHFTIGLDEEDRTIIQFGDGVFGRIPSADLPIFGTYRVGGGKIGDLAPNLINYVYDTDNDLSFIEEVTNEDWASGGSDYEDLERAKQLAPKHYRSREQAVTPTDFEDIAELTPGIMKAKCVETFTSTKVYLYVLGDNYTAPNEALCQLVKERIDANRVGNVDLEVLPCIITKFSVKQTVYVHDNFDKETVKAEVANSIRGTFSMDYFDFGTEFYASKLIDVAFGTAGVKNVVNDSEVTKDITGVGAYEILQLDDVTVEIGGV